MLIRSPVRHRCVHPTHTQLEQRVLERFVRDEIESLVSVLNHPPIESYIGSRVLELCACHWIYL
jgi:hypothetical protein